MEYHVVHYIFMLYRGNLNYFSDSALGVTTGHGQLCGV